MNNPNVPNLPPAPVYTEAELQRMWLEESGLSPAEIEADLAEKDLNEQL